MLQLWASILSLGSRAVCRKSGRVRFWAKTGTLHHHHTLACDRQSYIHVSFSYIVETLKHIRLCLIVNKVM